MSRCLVIINPVSGGGAARRYALDLQWKLSTLFETIEVKFTTGKAMLHVSQRMLANADSMLYSAWAVTAP